MSKTLFGHLAQFSSFSRQGEVLCTQGLKYLLDSAEASRTFSSYLSEQLNKSIPGLFWKSEAYQQEDRSRCDLEGSIDEKPLVKIEAKLDAAIGQGQLQSYLENLRKQSAEGGSLLVLVPRRRTNEIGRTLAGLFDLKGNGPWLFGNAPTCFIGLIFWEDVLDCLRSIQSEDFQRDFLQFEAMYRALNGSDIVPPSSESEILAWRNEERYYVRLVHYVTNRLTEAAQKSLLPFGTEGQPPQEYQRRYVCLPLGLDESCFSVGARDPFEGHKTPIWMRFHRATPGFQTISGRLLDSHFRNNRVASGGHLWLPLDVKINLEDDKQIESLLGQANEVIKVAYQPAAGT